MDFFISGTFWLIEGILCSIAFVGFKVWIEDRGIELNWWKWILMIFWVLIFGFTITLITTSLGEREIVAAFRGGIFFGVITIITFVGLWRLLGFPGTMEKQSNK
jgi:hypothetical protein